MLFYALYGFAFIAVLLVLAVKLSGKPVPGVPGPTHYPIVGNLPLILSPKWYGRIHDLFLEATRQHGTTWTAHIPGQPPTLMVVHPREVEHILRTNFHNYVKGPNFIARMGDLLGDGIFNSNGHQWKHQRQTASHLFKTRLMRSMIDVFVEHGQKVLDKLDALSPTDAIDIQDIFFRFTLDSIGQIAFGKNIDSLHKPVRFAKAFDFAQHAVNLRFFNPCWRLSFFQERELSAALKLLDEFAYSLIEERKTVPVEDLEQRTDLLSLYMRLEDHEGKPFSDKYLRDIIMNFLIAGRDTTAQTLSWLTYLLASNPKELEKVVAEVDAVLAGGVPTYDSVQHLSYLQACVDETLRLYPPVPGDPKYAVNDDVLPDGTFVPAGTTVSWLAYTMGRYEKFWDNPEEFTPSRWFEADGVTRKKLMPFLHIPFQAGPRTCLGQRMAYLEVKTMMSLFLQHYIPNLVSGQTITYKWTITLPAKNGIKVFVEKRPARINV